MREKDAKPFPNRALLPAQMDERPRTRIRQRIKRLLEDRGKTQREFARWLGHGDQWASNLLRGEFTLSLDELDRVGQFFNVPPSEIVRVSEDPWELSPTEMRVVRALRMLPPPVRDHMATLADYLIGTTPDEVELLRRIRNLGADQLHVVEQWIDLKMLEQVRGQGAPDRAAPSRADAPPTARALRTRAGGRK